MDINKEKKMISLEVYDELIDVVVSLRDEEKYRKAAKFVTDRFDVYAKKYCREKSEHTISLMTMLDIAVNPMSDNKCKGQFRSFWGRIIDYINLLKA